MWKSHAQWPLDTYKGKYGDGISTDIHNTEDQAKSVCRALEKDGFGGIKQVYPLKTWVTHVIDEKCLGMNTLCNTCNNDVKKCVHMNDISV